MFIKCTQAEYGPVNGTIDKDTRFSPVLAYGISKYAAGKLSKKLCDQYGMIHIWGRIFSVYGRMDNNNTLLDYAIKQFMNGEKAQFSSGKQKWNYLFEKDAGKLFLAMGEKVEESTELIVASDETRPLKEYIEVLAGIMECQELCEFAKIDNSKVFGIVPDVKNTVKTLGINSFTPFCEGIREMIHSRQLSPIP